MGFYLHVFTIIGLAILAIAGFALYFMESSIVSQQNSEISIFQRNSTGIKLSVDSLNDQYLVGQQIDFNITTTSKQCSRPSVIVTSENGTIIWTSRPDPMYCDIVANSWPRTQNWHLTEGGLGSLAIYEEGIYKIGISFLGNTIEKTLRIIPTYSH
jgi:hypothetical protein